MHLGASGFCVLLMKIKLTPTTYPDYPYLIELHDESKPYPEFFLLFNSLQSAYTSWWENPKARFGFVALKPVNSWRPNKLDTSVILAPDDKQLRVKLKIGYNASTVAILPRLIEFYTFEPKDMCLAKDWHMQISSLSSVRSHTEQTKPLWGVSDGLFTLPAKVFGYTPVITSTQESRILLSCFTIMREFADRKDTQSIIPLFEKAYKSQIPIPRVLIQPKQDIPLHNAHVYEFSGKYDNYLVREDRGYFNPIVVRYAKHSDTLSPELAAKLMEQSKPNEKMIPGFKGLIYLDNHIEHEQIGRFLFDRSDMHAAEYLGGDVFRQHCCEFIFHNEDDLSSLFKPSLLRKDVEDEVVHTSSFSPK